MYGEGKREGYFRGASAIKAKGAYLKTMRDPKINLILIKKAMSEL
jgi:hypothetical protein